MDEANAVVTWIRNLLGAGAINGKVVHEEDIAVITPYSRQSKTIARKCNQEQWTNLTIGTTELLQGQEKPVVIISTVRTSRHLGEFVTNPRVSWISQTINLPCLIFFFYLISIAH